MRWCHPHKFSIIENKCEVKQEAKAVTGRFDFKQHRKRCDADMDRKYVSVILPTYNRARSIRGSMESILRQTYPHWELLVIDDGSTDHTEEIVSEIAGLDPRVHYHGQSQNRGVAAARNEGIRQARYEYIAFQDSDDIWKEDKLERQMRVFDEQPQVGMVYCAYEGTRQDGVTVQVPDRFIEIKNLQGNLYRQLLQQNVIGGPTAVIRRECLDNVGGFDETLTCLEDWELFLRIAQRYEIGYAEGPLLAADIHEGGVSSRVGGYFQARCMMVVQHRAALLEYGIFQQTVEQILMTAKDAGVLEKVAQMMQNMLAG